MIKKTKTTQEVIISRRYCDVCGAEVYWRLQCSVAQCKICGRDLCERCVEYEVDTMGDYREVYCERCWGVGEPYRKAIKEHEKEINRLNDEWIEILTKAET